MPRIMVLFHEHLKIQRFGRKIHPFLFGTIAKNRFGKRKYSGISGNCGGGLPHFVYLGVLIHLLKKRIILHQVADIDHLAHMTVQRGSGLGKVAVDCLRDFPAIVI